MKECDVSNMDSFDAIWLKGILLRIRQAKRRPSTAEERKRIRCRAVLYTFGWESSVLSLEKSGPSRDGGRAVCVGNQGQYSFMVAEPPT